MTRSQSNEHRKALELAQSGDNEQAVECLRRHLDSQPQDAQALNDLGVLLFTLGKLDQAAESFTQAAGILGDSDSQALVNLAEVHLAGASPQRALAILEHLADGQAAAKATEPPAWVELASRTAVALMEQGDHARAIEAVLLSLAAQPGQEELQGVLEKLRGTRPKVAVFREHQPVENAHAVLEFIARRYPTQSIRGQLDQAGKIAGPLSSCSIAWFEGASASLAEATAQRQSCRMVCRLGPQDVFGPWLERVQWEHVDAVLVRDNPAHLQVLMQRVPGLAHEQIITIPSGVDVGAIAFAPRTGKNLACVGPIGYSQNPAGLIQCFHRLHSQDASYRLVLAGAFSDRGELQQYLRSAIADLGLSAAVSFEGWQDDWTAWLSDKDFLVTASLVDDQREIILKAMAAGVRPVVHAFPGSGEVLGPEFLFRTSDEFCRRIMHPCSSEFCRKRAVQRYPLSAQLRRVGEVLATMEEKGPKS